MKYLLPVIILLFACGFVSAQAQGEIPEGAKICLKGCCDQVNGEYDEKTSYCNIDYETSIKESFQSCQMNCVAQNLQKPAEATTPTTLGGQSTEQTNQSSNSKLPCMSMLLPLITIALAGILKI
jgi:hypothetical protein